MSRPRVSEINMERIQKFSGDSFDDKLGMLLTIHSLKCNEAERLSGQLEASRDYVRELTESVINNKKSALDWKSAAILTGIGLICALGYIGWML